MGKNAGHPLIWNEEAGHTLSGSEWMAIPLGNRLSFLGIWPDLSPTDTWGQKTDRLIGRNLRPPAPCMCEQASPPWLMVESFHLHPHVLKVTRPDPGKYLNIIHLQQSMPPFNHSLTINCKMLPRHKNTQNDFLSHPQWFTFHVHLHSNVLTLTNS